MTTKIGQVRQALGLVAKAPVSVVLARIQKLQDEMCHQAEHHEKAIEWRVRGQVKQEFAAQISTLRSLLGASESETVESAASRVRAAAAAADLPSEAAWGHLHLQLLEANAAIKRLTAERDDARDALNYVDARDALNYPKAPSEVRIDNVYDQKLLEAGLKQKIGRTGWLTWNGDKWILDDVDITDRLMKAEEALLEVAMALGKGASEDLIDAAKRIMTERAGLLDQIATFRIKQDWEQRKATKASDTPSAFTVRVRERLRNVFCRELTTEESQLTFAFAEEWARLAQRHSAATSSGTSSSDS